MAIHMTMAPHAGCHGIYETLSLPNPWHGHFDGLFKVVLALHIVKTCGQTNLLLIINSNKCHGCLFKLKYLKIVCILVLLKECG